MKKTLTMIALLIGLLLNAQTLVWKGTVDNDFFNEANWQNSSTLLAPTAGTINPGVAIVLPLSITNVTKKIIANGTINLGTATLTISNATLSGAAIIYGTSVTIQEKGYIDLSDANPISGVPIINFQSDIAWLKLLNVKSSVVEYTYISIFRSNGQASVHGNNLRLDKYYLNGCVIRLIGVFESPMDIFSGVNLSGTVGFLTSSGAFTGTGISVIGDNNLESFVLRKGYMATLSTNSDGTGKSKVYIASEEDLIINQLPAMLNNTVSFIRVLPWNWVTKKGIAHTTYQYLGLNATWRYDWNDNSATNASLEFVPMSWGSSGTLPASISQRIADRLTHQLGFNEPDNPGQSGGYNNFTDYNVTVPYYKELMKIGCRLVSPGCEESGVFTYLGPFNTLAKSSGVRIDAVAIHWSDWEGYSAGETGVSGQKIFDRFKIHLKKVYDMHGVPIWITEFNANPNRSAAIQEAFMTLALPYLESCEYVERYSWFQSPTNANLYVGQIEANGITPLGIIYRDHISTPSIPESVVNQRNNLNLKQ